MEIQMDHRPMLEHLAHLLGPDSKKLKPILLSFLLGLAVRIIHGSDAGIEEEASLFANMVQSITDRKV